MIQVVSIMSRLNMDQVPRIVHPERQSLISTAQVNRRSIRNQANKLRIMFPIKLHIVRVATHTLQKILNQLVRQLLNLQILRQIQEHRARPSVSRDVKRIIHREWHLGRALDLITPLCDGSHNFHRRATLKGILWRRGRGLSAKDDEGNAVAHGICDGSDEVGRSWSGCGNDDSGGELSIANFSGGLGDALSDVSGGTFVGVGDPSDALRFAVAGVVLMELIEEGEDGAPRVAVDDLYVVFEKLGVDDVGGSFALEGVHVGPCGVFGG
mmetsp:Transcript_41621/g.87358  ORF Transcript_41621/g.87358 Transcript_41621/m.87358 type:complete len:268 (-) Transcript_41621:481-1284(-)